MGYKKSKDKQSIEGKVITHPEMMGEFPVIGIKFLMIKGNDDVIEVRCWDKGAELHGKIKKHMMVAVEGCFVHAEWKTVDGATKEIEYLDAASVKEAG